MAHFTELLRDVDAHHNVVKCSLMKYPIFDEGYRTPLNQKILDHYWMREIGQETPDMFLFFLRRKMNEIMPYYNQLYKTEQLSYDPLLTLDIRQVSDSAHSEESSSEAASTQKGDSDSTSRAVNSEFPQEMLRGDGNYATNAADSTGETKSTSESDSVGSGTSDGTSHNESRQYGRAGTGASLVAEYRAQLLNIDLMVISELDSLFMGLYATSDYNANEPGMFYRLPIYPYGLF